MIITPSQKCDEPPRLSDLVAAIATGDGKAPSEKAKPRGAAGGVSLGTNAKSSSTAQPCGFQGVMDIEGAAHKVLRFQAQSQSRHILEKDAKANGAKYPGNYHKTCACRYVSHGDIGVMKNIEHGTCFYKGLVTCGSPWACPPCASVIQERRRDEIKQAIAWAESQGLVVLLVTFTFPHYVWHGLRDLILQQREAFKRLRRGRAWMAIKPVGLIRSLEVTHGERNGWHPHTHELWFCEPDKVPGRYDILKLWAKACAGAGLLDVSNAQAVGYFNQYSVDVKRDMTEGDYLAKQDDSRSWGFAEEVSKATSKAGRSKGVHPHHFLVRQAEGDDERFLEYANAMKGQRQLFWSPGLKDRVGLDDLDDETLADEMRDPADFLSLITPDDWKLVRGNELRAELLLVAQRDGVPGIKSFLSSLRGAGVATTSEPSEEKPRQPPARTRWTLPLYRSRFEVHHGIEYEIRDRPIKPDPHPLRAYGAGG